MQIEPDGSLLTKGDANPTPDAHNPPLTEDKVIGKVLSVYNPLQLAAVAILLLAAWIFLSYGRPSNGPTQEKSSDREDVIDNSDKPRQFELSADS